MGISSKQGKSETFNWVNDRKDTINSILDIGAGSGTYHTLLSPIKDFTWIGVEAWQEYIDKFLLKDKYAILHNSDIRKFNWSDINVDLAIAGDVLEHMSKEEAIELVNTILDHTNVLIISIPIVHMPQDEVNGNPYEIHVKDDWTHTEVLDSWNQYIIDYWIPTGKKVQVGVYWLSK